MDPVVPCLPQTQHITPAIAVAAPGYVLVGKTCTDPASQVVTQYCEPTTLNIRLSTSPPGLFRGRAALTGTGIGRIAVPPQLLQHGVLTPLQDGAGPGWWIPAGVLASPLDIAVQALAPSLLNEDIELVLTLEASGAQTVGAPASARMTAVELSLDIDDVARRNDGPAPQKLSPYAKVFDGAVVIADCLEVPLPRTRLTLRRATPYNFPHRLEIVVHDEDGSRDHVLLCTDEVPGGNGLVLPVLDIDNLQLPLFGGQACYVQGRLRYGTPGITVEVRVQNGTFGDYLNLFVEPYIGLRWGAAWAYPACAQPLLAASVQQGDDRTDNLCTADIIVDTGGLPPDAVANVTIHRCDAGQTLVPVAGLDGLTADQRGQLRTPQGRRPGFSSVGALGSWVPWNAPYFFFKVDFPALAIQRGSPHDAAAQPARCLKVKYLHAFVIDGSAVELEPVQCRNQILSHIKGETLGDAAEAVATAALADHRFLRPDLDGLAGGFADWLAVARDTYAYFHFSHGDHGLLAFGQHSFNATDVFTHAQSNERRGGRDFPRHLMFLASCHSALDPSLARTLIAGRPDCYVIGFRRTNTRKTVQALAGRFFHVWLVLRRGDPATIPACFAIASADHIAVEPCLFHRQSDFSYHPLG